MLKSYLPILVFGVLGAVVGIAFTMLNHVIGAKRRPGRVGEAGRRQVEPYESGIPVDVSYYLIAMLFILFDIEVVFLYPVGVILKASDSVFVLAEVLIFVFLLLVALAYVWRKGALDWK